jgi:hypothetical protein
MRHRRMHQTRRRQTIHCDGVEAFAPPVRAQIYAHAHAHALYPPLRPGGLPQTACTIAHLLLALLIRLYDGGGGVTGGMRCAAAAAAAAPRSTSRRNHMRQCTIVDRKEISKRSADGARGWRRKSHCNTHKLLQQSAASAISYLVSSSSFGFMSRMAVSLRATRAFSCVMAVTAAPKALCQVAVRVAATWRAEIVPQASLSLRSTMASATALTNETSAPAARAAAVLCSRRHSATWRACRQNRCPPTLPACRSGHEQMGAFEHMPLTHVEACCSICQLRPPQDKHTRTSAAGARTHEHCVVVVCAQQEMACKKDLNMIILTHAR